MKKNLCKFTSGLPGSTLSVYQYIRETEWAIMHEAHRMLRHRMILIMQGDGIFSFDSVSFFTLNCLISERYVSWKKLKGGREWIRAHSIMKDLSAETKMP